MSTHRLTKPTPAQVARSNYRAHPLYRRCVGHWLFNEGQGLTAYDISGYGNHGTLTNMVIGDWTTGEFGHPALTLDGVDAHINIPSNAILTDLKQSGGMTLVARMQINSIGSGDFLFRKANGQADGWWIIIESGSNERIGFGDDWSSGDVKTAIGNNLWAAGDWIHYVMAWNGADNTSGTDALSYLNGLDVTGTTNAGGTDTKTDVNSDFQIGDPSTGFDGVIDDVRLYNRMLSPVEIRQLYFNPYIMFRPVEPIYFVDTGGGGPVTVERTMVGSVTPTGALTLQTQQVYAGVITPVGTLINQIQTMMAGSITPTGASTHILTILRSMVGAITPTGSFLMTVGKLLAGAITPTGTLTNQAQLTMTGSITPTGTLATLKAVLITIVGGITPTGTLSTATTFAESLAGAITPVGALTKKVLTTMLGAISPSGALTVLKNGVSTVNTVAAILRRRRRS